MSAMIYILCQEGNLGEGQAIHGLNIHLLKTWEWWYEPLEEKIHNGTEYFFEVEFQFKNQYYDERKILEAFNLSWNEKFRHFLWI